MITKLQKYTTPGNFLAASKERKNKVLGLEGKQTKQRAQKGFPYKILMLNVSRKRSA